MQITARQLGRYAWRQTIIAIVIALVGIAAGWILTAENSPLSFWCFGISVGYIVSRAIHSIAEQMFLSQELRKISSQLSTRQQILEKLLNITKE